MREMKKMSCESKETPIQALFAAIGQGGIYEYSATQMWHFYL